MKHIVICIPKRDKVYWRHWGNTAANEMNDKLWDILSVLKISGKLEKQSWVDLMVDEDFNFVQILSKNDL